VKQRRILTLSLAVIAAAWSYTIWMAVRSPFVAPAQFSTLILDIVIRKTIVLSVIVALLWAGRETLRSIGFVSPRWIPAIGRGVVYGLLVFIILNVVLPTALAAVVNTPGAENAGSLTVFFRDPAHLLAWIPIGVIGGGLVEEIERAFVLTRFEQWLGKYGIHVGLALSSAIFGVAHLYQSSVAGLSAAVSGLVFGLIYLRRRSAIEAAASHACADLLGVIAATLLAG
jgi:membrane protease YdiL (CAAX protease family)